MLDLGQLLLSCHYDLAHPFSVAPDAARIRAVMDGYLAYRGLTASERRSLEAALRFGLAYHAGHYLAQAVRLEEDDTVLTKLQVRWTATADIARIAATESS